MIRRRLLQLLARPVLIPVAVGGFGLWYGTFDLTYQGSYQASSLIFGGVTEHASKSARVVSGLVGISVGAGTMYMANSLYPSQWKPPTASFEFKGAKDIVPLIKNAMSSFQSFPIRRIYALVIMSGVASGLVRCATERILFVKAKRRADTEQ
mmetsp:Transcript_23978/g.35192  ORF Transcript_23978/g.35192 Transcript_23978/m.35192 type:complete len:152 (+) Transcript_23978:73-528(+)|eukprot:CAMPEP_0185036108 /NCGR_PEP_ID=MMETSP1103-20130426/28570_1 /TAXON_ID=36769 /ORGANISM="Paraphysomonas bandaiensis, Strain Caron Lab Isolate" /LENGTH=151 /DNA_ID=CAMNT_0027573501 /DNA_START=40 /DNA_END=495 /DNA_ORIENTATION=+